MRGLFRFVPILILFSVLSCVPTQAFAQENTATPDNPTWPWSTLPIDLAAVPLPADSFPAGWTDHGEIHQSLNSAGVRNLNVLTPKQVLATGYLGDYTSHFGNTAGDQIRIDAMEFRTAANVAGGFALFEDHDLINPNADLSDRPALPGVGSAPGEVTSGYFQMEDGYQTFLYSVKFRVGPLLLTVEMETSDESSLEIDLINTLAGEEATRAQQVVDGTDLPDIETALPAQIVWPDGNPNLYDGFKTSTENFLIATMGQIPDGMISSYRVTFSLLSNENAAFPRLDETLIKFDSTEAVTAAMADPVSLITPGIPELTHLDDPAVTGADAARAFSFNRPDIGPSSRVYVQSGPYLIIVGVDGAIDDSSGISTATSWAAADLNCLIGNGCAIPEQPES